MGRVTFQASARFGHGIVLVFGIHGHGLDFVMTGETHIRRLVFKHLPVIGSVRAMTAYTVISCRLMNELNSLWKTVSWKRNAQDRLSWKGSAKVFIQQGHR